MTPAKSYAAEISAINVKIENIERCQRETDTALRPVPVMKERIDTMSTIVDTHNRALYGVNGTPGLVGKVSAVEEKMDDLKRLVMAVATAVTIAIAIQIISIVGERLP